ncbi:MAG: universal stress protein [Actinomycetota bacterium]|nr:universal stress protein [Actinomycetota bacterium]
MFKKIIIATDLSPAADALVNCLGGLKAFGTEEVLILQWINVQMSDSIALSYSTPLIEKSLQYQKEIVEKQGLKVKTRIVTGSPGRELVKISEEENFPLIVVGAQKHSAIGEAFFGGLAYNVIHNSHKPVLLIRLETDKKKDLSCVSAVSSNINNHILFVTDFSDNADNAFFYVKKMVSAGVKKVTLLHVQDKTRIEPHLTERLQEFNEIDNERLLNLKKELLENNSAEIDIKLVYGYPPIEIMRLIDELNIPLVVMGRQGRGFAKELFVGSVSSIVARGSDASVLLIPAEP